MSERLQILCGDALEKLKEIPDASVQMCATSPPYFALRSYLPKDDPNKHREIGTEQTPDEYVANLVAIFSEVRRVLRDDGVLWLNLGDSFSNDGKWGGSTGGKHVTALHGDSGIGRAKRCTGLKPKDLIGVPWMVAFALRADGWYLRQWIPWVKRNCLSGGAWVYVRSQKGDMPMMIKDLARLDPSTIKLWNGCRWTQMVDIQRVESEDEIEIELRSGERIGCTPDHRWPTERGLLEAGALRIGDILKRVRLPEPEIIADPQFLPAEWTGWFIGLFIAEGWIDKNGHILLSGHENETASRMKHLAPMVDNLHGRMWSSNHGGKSHSIHISCPALTGVVSTYVYGSNAHTKCLTPKCWQRSDSFLSALVRGYLDGDGHKDPHNIGRWRLGFCNNDNLARDLRTACARIGVEIRLRRGVASCNGKPFKTWRGEIRLTRPAKAPASGRFQRKHDTEIVAIRKSRARTFWDIGVADDPHVFALASGLVTHNSMPESVEDRPASACEMIFLLTKQADYFYDYEAVKLPASMAFINDGRWKTGSTLINDKDGYDDAKAQNPKSPHRMFDKQRGHSRRHDGFNDRWDQMEKEQQCSGWRTTRNSDWFFEGLLSNELGDPLAFVVSPANFKEAHFATWPPNLVRPMILAGSKSGDTVLDPFAGAFTTAMVALELGRKAIAIELNPDYVKIGVERCNTVTPGFSFA